MSKTIEARIIEIEHPGGRVDYEGQLNYKRTLFGIPLWDNWVTVTGKSSYINTKESLQRKKTDWEYKNNKKKRVVEEF